MSFLPAWLTPPSSANVFSSSNLLAALLWAMVPLSITPSAIHAQKAIQNVAVGADPSAVAVDPGAHRLYVANSGGSTVTVLDESGHAVATVDTGNHPVAVAVDSISHQIFVANYGSNTVSVIDGTTQHLITTMPVGQAPYAIAVAPATHRIYVANSGSNTVSIIDETTLTVISTLTVGTDPVAIAMNPVTDLIYVANKSSNTVTVIDGAGRAVAATINAGKDPVALAVNPVTARIYVADLGSDSVTVIDGAAQNVAAAVSTGKNPAALALDPMLNQIYVANTNSGSVTIIDGATNRCTTVIVGLGPQAIAVNPVSNRVYVANISDADVTVMDGSIEKVINTIETGPAPVAIAANPVTDHIYVANNGGNNMTVIDEASNAHGPSIGTGANWPINGSQRQQSAAIPVPLKTRLSAVSDRQTLAITPVFKTTNARPHFTAIASSSYADSARYSNVAVTSSPPPTAVYFRVDDLEGPWTAAVPNSFSGANPASFSIALSTGQTLGRHVLYAFAAYGAEGTPESGGNGTGNSPEIGSLQRMAFYVGPLPTVTVLTTDAVLNGNSYTANLGTTVSFSVSVMTAVTGAGVNVGQITFYDDKKLLGAKELASGGTYQPPSLAAGRHFISVRYKTHGKSRYLASSSNVLVLDVVPPSAKANP